MVLESVVVAVKEAAKEMAEKALETVEEIVKKEVDSLPEQIGELSEVKDLPDEIGGIEMDSLPDEIGDDMPLESPEHLNDVQDNGNIEKIKETDAPEKKGGSFDEVFKEGEGAAKKNDGKDAGQNERKDSKESDIEKKDSILEKIEKILTTPEGIKALIERHPEKAELWKSQLEALDTLNDPEASTSEIRSAQAKLSILKGQLLETAMKDVLSDIGFDVEALQRVVEGESGGTRPDVIAKNNTDRPMEVFGGAVKPGETLSVECKCGGSAYMTNELNNHIPNQLSGQEGKKILVTTSDIKDTPAGAADAVCRQYGARLVVLDVSVADVENAIKEVAKS